MATVRTFTALLALISAVAVIDAKQKYQPYDFPNPRLNSRECGRGEKASYVCDPSNYLDERGANDLDFLIRQATSQTKCVCSTYRCVDLNTGGVKIGIALVEQMMTQEEIEGGEEPEYKLKVKLNDAAVFAQVLANSWDIDVCGEGLIIFYSVYDHVLFTHTDEKTSTVLHNDVIAEISMMHRIKFERGLYAEGFSSLIQDYIDVLNGEYKKRVNTPEEPIEPQAWKTGAAGALKPLAASLLMIVLTFILHF